MCFFHENIPVLVRFLWNVHGLLPDDHRWISILSVARLSSSTTPLDALPASPLGSPWKLTINDWDSASKIANHQTRVFYDEHWHFAMKNVGIVTRSVEKNKYHKIQQCIIIFQLEIATLGYTLDSDKLKWVHCLNQPQSRKTLMFIHFHN